MDKSQWRSALNECFLVILWINIYSWNEYLLRIIGIFFNKKVLSRYSTTKIVTLAVWYTHSIQYVVFTLTSLKLPMNCSPLKRISVTQVTCYTKLNLWLWPFGRKQFSFAQLFSHCSTNCKIYLCLLLIFFYMEILI